MVRAPDALDGKRLHRVAARCTRLLQETTEYNSEPPGTRDQRPETRDQGPESRTRDQEAAVKGLWGRIPKSGAYKGGSPRQGLIDWALGPKGPKGPKGYKGPKRAKGPKGPKGLKGPIIPLLTKEKWGPQGLGPPGLAPPHRDSATPAKMAGGSLDMSKW